MRLGIGVEFDGDLSRTDYCHGLVCWRKEATRGPSNGQILLNWDLSCRADETRIDMLRDHVVAAFEAQAADSADSEIARAIACQSKKRIEKLAVV